MDRFLFLVTLIVLQTHLAFSNELTCNQLSLFKESTKTPVAWTQNSGAPVTESSTTGLKGSVLRNLLLVDSLNLFNYERIPERVVHASGAGAAGYFEVTHDITKYCKADFLSEVGKITPVTARFSPVSKFRGSSDLVRDAVGFGIKFYTKQGNWDLVGLNFPVFVIKDPLFFPSFIHSVKNNPVTNVPDYTAQWDFITSRPESIHLFSYFYSDLGIPDGYQHMNGFGIHTFQVENAVGDTYFVRFHFTPKEGVRNLTSEQATKIGETEPYYQRKYLYDAIGSGNYPEWEMGVQILTNDDIKNASINVFDVTLALPTDQYPVRPVGKLVLNKNVLNYFAQLEQFAIDPLMPIPGILGAPDKLFEGRAFTYKPAQAYRIGSNMQKILVNQPLVKTYTYTRDGPGPVLDNGLNSPNYYPNSFNGPVPSPDNDVANKNDILSVYVEPNATNFGQVSNFYQNELNEEQRTRFVKNIASTLVNAEIFIIHKALEMFSKINLDLSKRIYDALGTVCKTC